MTLSLLIRRLLLMVPMVYGIVTVTFFVTHVLPGDPTYQILGQFATPEKVAETRHLLGFDQPLLEQYWHYLTGLVLHFDLGISLLVTSNSVKYDLAQRLPSTLELVFCALAVALAIGIPAGAWAAKQRFALTRRGRSGDVAVRTAGFILLSAPEFWFALVASFFFFYKWQIAPAPLGQLGFDDPQPHRYSGAAALDSILSGNWGAFTASLAHLAVPVLAYGLALAAPISRFTRSSMIDVLSSDYIRFARSQGVRPFTLWRYSVRAALPPVVTFSGVLFVLLLGSSVLVEKIFSWGGAAQYAADAIAKNDYSPVAGFVLVSGLIAVGIFFLVDIVYVLIDPRVKLGGGGGGTFAALRLAVQRDGVAGAACGLATRLVTGLVRPFSGVARGVAALPAAGAWARAVGRDLGGSLPTPGALLSGLRALPRSTVACWRTGKINPALAIGVLIIAGLVICSFLVPAISDYGPRDPNPDDSLQAPSWNHPFGTDTSGFDIFVRALYAPRIDLLLAVEGVGLGLLIGVAVGLFAGFSRGWLGDVALRITDVIQAFPLLILALALVALDGNKLINVVWALAFLNAPLFLRQVRAQVLTIRELRFIEAGVALGNPTGRLILRHVLPNALGPVIVQFGLSLGYAIVTVASLAFLGVGVQVPTPEWGSMILIGKDAITTGQWWTFVFPGLMLALVVSGFNLLADGVERAREVTRH